MSSQKDTRITEQAYTKVNLDTGSHNEINTGSNYSILILNCETDLHKMPLAFKEGKFRKRI